MRPRVSFVVPCYKLGHLLPDCLNSVLSQSFEDFEVLVMDDRSPDSTRDVMEAYHDRRIRYIRNEENLGHLRNYNKGISLSQGDYVWLISADDRLHRNCAVERYVSLMDKEQRAGYVFCPAIRLENGQEAGVIPYSVHGRKDRLFDGRRFFKQLIRENTIVAASSMVRRRCYDDISLFPLDMPWGGDWYLWCLFALHFDVAYVADPLVCYRRHDQSMTTILMEGSIANCAAEDVHVPWAMKRFAEANGIKGVRAACLQAAASEYARCMGTYRYHTSTALMSVDEIERSLDENGADESEKRWIRARAYGGGADWHRWAGNLHEAHQLYRLSLQQNRWRPLMWLQWILSGPSGWQSACGRAVRQMRRVVRHLVRSGRRSDSREAMRA